jgi:hypothetical protein
VRSRRDYNKETGFLQLPYRNVNQSGKIAPRSRVNQNRNGIER